MTHGGLARAGPFGRYDHDSFVLLSSSKADMSIVVAKRGPKRRPHIAPSSALARKLRPSVDHMKLAPLASIVYTVLRAITTPSSVMMCVWRRQLMVL